LDKCCPIYATKRLIFVGDMLIKVTALFYCCLLGLFNSQVKVEG